MPWIKKGRSRERERMEVLIFYDNVFLFSSSFSCHVKKSHEDWKVETWITKKNRKRHKVDYNTQNGENFFFFAFFHRLFFPSFPHFHRPPTRERRKKWNTSSESTFMFIMQKTVKKNYTWKQITFDYLCVSVDCCIAKSYLHEEFTIAVWNLIYRNMLL